MGPVQKNQSTSVPVGAAKLGTDLAVEIRGITEPALVDKRPYYRGT